MNIFSSRNLSAIVLLLLALVSLCGCTVDKNMPWQRPNDLTQKEMRKISEDLLRQRAERQNMTVEEYRRKEEQLRKERMRRQAESLNKYRRAGKWGAVMDFICGVKVPRGPEGSDAWEKAAKSGGPASRFSGKRAHTSQSGKERASKIAAGIMIGVGAGSVVAK